MDHWKKLIKPPGYSWELLKDIFENTCLEDKCEFIFWNENLSEVCQALTAILKGEVDLEELPTLLVAAMLIFLVRNKPDLCNERITLLTVALQCSDSLDPILIHKSMERIVSILKQDLVSTAFNFLTITNRISGISIMGKPISVCMLWYIISELTDCTEVITMHRFREISELLDMLYSVEMDELIKNDELKRLYALVNAVSFLLSLVLYGSNEYLKAAGYPEHFFFVTKTQLTTLYSWFTNLIRKIIKCQRMDEYFELRNVIIDHVNFIVLSSLNERIDSDGENASDSGTEIISG